LIEDATSVGSAIVVWTGWGEAMRPLRDKQLLVNRFGLVKSEEIYPIICKLVEEFYASDARFVVAGLKEMGNAAANQFREKYPELPDDAVRALAWCYTYDYK
jgi:hypothetical protein